MNKRVVVIFFKWILRKGIVVIFFKWILKKGKLAIVQTLKTNIVLVTVTFT